MKNMQRKIHVRENLNLEIIHQKISEVMIIRRIGEEQVVEISMREAYRSVVPIGKGDFMVLVAILEVPVVSEVIEIGIETETEVDDFICTVVALVAEEKLVGMVKKIESEIDREDMIKVKRNIQIEIETEIETEIEIEIVIALVIIKIKAVIEIAVILPN